MVRFCIPRPRPIVLIYYHPVLKVHVPVPLKAVGYEVDVRGPLAEFRLTQTYKNNTPDHINVTYEFPRTDESCFTKFEARFQNRVVEGKIKPKDVAKQEFEQHKALGSTVAYAEMKENEEDIMRIELGNFPAGEELIITFTFVDLLDLVASKYWKLVIPSTLTPRYKKAPVNAPPSDDISFFYPCMLKAGGVAHTPSHPVQPHHPAYLGPPVRASDEQQPPTANVGNLNAGFAAKFGGFQAAQIGAGAPDPTRFNVTPTIQPGPHPVQPQGILPGGCVVHPLPHPPIPVPIPGPVSVEFVMDEGYPWAIRVNLHQSGGQEQLFCATHKDRVSIQKNADPSGKTVTTVSLIGVNYPDRDFELMFTDATFHNPTCEIMAKQEALTDASLPTRCAQMFFVPKFADYAKFDQNGHQIPDEGEEIAHYMENVRANFMFIIDRSGSMQGERIEIAKKALELCLRSLPYDSFFNVISFGNSFTFLHPKSVKANEATINAAVAAILGFGADMGGTEIMSAMTACFNAPTDEGYQKIIFLLTDGSVSNSLEIVKKTKESCENNRNRVFTVGIGNGVSDQFIKGVARAGNGSSDIIHNLTIIEDKIISLLKSSFSPALSNFRVEYDHNFIEALAPDLTKDCHVLKDKPLRLSAFIKNSAHGTTNVKVTYYDSVQKKDNSIVFSIDTNKIAGNKDFFHKMLVQEMIKEVDSGLSKTLPPGEWQTHMAVAYQVLCPKTAFICVIKDATEGGGVHAAQQVIVPQMVSVDYGGGGGMMGGLPGAPMMMRSMAMPMKKSMASGGGMMPMAMASQAMPMSMMSAAPTMKMKMDAQICRESFDSGSISTTSTTATQMSAKPTKGNVDTVIRLQSFNGEFPFHNDLLNELLPGAEAIRTSLGLDQNTFMTLVVAAWLKKHYTSAKYVLLINKSIAFLKSKGVIFKDLESKVNAQL